MYYVQFYSGDTMDTLRGLGGTKGATQKTTNQVSKYS